MPNSTLAQMGFLDEDTQQEAVYDLEDTQARTDISTINGKIPSTASSSNKMATASDITDINNKIPSNASSSNKLATISDVSAAYKPKGNATLATLPSLTAEHLNWVYNMTEDFVTTSDFAEGAGKSVKAGNEVGIIDVSTTSTPSYKYTVLGGFVDTSSLQPKTLDTPIEIGGVNRTTVETALGALANDKEDTILAATPLVKEYDEIMHQEVLRLTQDDAPTNNSNNPVKSGGIYTALADKASKANVIANTKLIKDTVGWSGKNLLPIKESATMSGITFTVNSDGTVTVNGTATARAEFVYLVTSKTDYSKYAGKDVILTGCPAGGAIGTYFLGEWDSTQNVNRNDYGEGVRFTFPAEKPSDFNLKIRIENGQTVSNLVFKPMLREATILDDTYEAPHESVKDTLREAEVIKGKNIFDTRNAVANRADLTHVKNKDLSLSISAGTATNEWFYPANQDLLTPLNVKAGQKYKLSYGKTLITNLRVQVFYKETSVSSYVQLANESTKSYVEFTAPNTFYNIWARFSVAAGNSIAACTIYPMLTLADENLDYETFYGSPLKDSMFPRSEQAVLGAKNLLENTATSQSVNGVVYVVNADGTVTANNKATANATLRLNKIYNLPSGTYKYTGCPSGGGSSTYQGWVGIRNAGDTAWLSSYTDTGSGVEFTVDASQTSYVQVEVEVRNNYTADNLLFYPMIRLATDTDPTYQPYAMTNKELTERFAKVPFTIPSTTGSVVKLADYPSGFNNSNAVIINFAIDGRVGIGQFGTTYNRCFVQLASSEIQIFNGESGNVGKTGYLILGKL